MGAFSRQLWALCWKNLLILFQHPVLNLIRYFIFPIAFGVFIGEAQHLLVDSDFLGLGSPRPVKALADVYDASHPLYWTQLPGAATSSLDITPAAIMEHLSAGLSDIQRQGIQKKDNLHDIAAACPQNFNGHSQCYAAIVFTSLPSSSAVPPIEDPIHGLKIPNNISYTIQADAGLSHVDIRGQGDFELRHMPIQMALDQAIVALSTGMELPVPKEWPFTGETNEFEADQLRLLYVSLIAGLMVLALFIAYVGIAYTLPGAFAFERANLLTAHLKASGLQDSARIISWLLVQSLVYLPSWIIIGVIWQQKIFVNTNVVLILAINIINGVLLASHGLFLAVPFGKSPQLAAVTSIFGALVSAIIAWTLASGLFGTFIGTSGAIILSLFLPGGFYIFAMEAVCNFERELMAPNMLKGDPQNNLMILPLMIVALIEIFLYSWLAVQWERWLYDAHEPRTTRSGRWFSRRSRDRHTEEPSTSLPSNIAISVRGLSKVFPAPRLSKRKPVTAISDLSFDVPKNGIFVLLGSNGAGKSTSLGIIGGLLGRTGGEIIFADGHGGTGRPQRGDIGLVPQKNVLFDDLTCMQNLRVWQAVKRPAADKEEDLRQLLIDCDLGRKIHAKAGTLSGGQKRKLQLAAGLVGGSSILLVDECTSGVDPLSRRSLWKTLNFVRGNRTVVFTTHFLDEADLLGDMVAILASPGKLIAQGTPVELKSSLGSGYTLLVTFEDNVPVEEYGPLSAHINRYVLPVVPQCQMKLSEGRNAEYHLGTKDPKVVEAVIRQVEHMRTQLGIHLLDVRGSSLESIFLGLMGKEQSPLQPHGDAQDDKLDMKALSRAATELPELKRTHSVDRVIPQANSLNLTSGRPRSFIGQTMTIFYKRVLVARRSWLTPLFAMVVAIMGACASVGFVDKIIPTCDVNPKIRGLQSMFVRTSDFTGIVDDTYDDQFFKHNIDNSVITSPPGILHTMGPIFTNVSAYNVTNTDAFVETINSDYQHLRVGGFSLDSSGGKDISQTQVMFAYESTPGEVKGPVMLNLVNNILFNQALNSTGKSSTAAGPIFILPSYQDFSFAQRSLDAIRWIVFFGLVMAVYPAFFSSYVAKERRSGVQAMQLSNGLTNPAGLWLGHLLFDGIFTVIISLVLVLVYATTGHGFIGLGYLWLVLLLYGISGTLFSYCISLLVKTPLAAFAATAASQAVFFLLYLAGYLLILTYSQVSDADRDMNTLHFTISLLSPVGSLIRAAYVSINLFDTACGGGLGVISRYGGPILYLIGQSALYFVILVVKDTGSLLRRRRSIKDAHPPNTRAEGAMMRVLREDVNTEAARVSASNDILKVMQVSKSFGGKTVVDNLTFGADRGTILALLGPNGAGKTTTFNMIRGDITPTAGQILVDGTSVVSQPRVARASLGVCPQFTAIDSQLSVAEHLAVYGRLKGLRSGAELNSNIEQILHATGLVEYRDRFASRLSGGNQRKLSLAIALMGNPAVLLIDEFSSGVDANLKREMWATLRSVSAGKALVITTHSMEEASAISNKVAIVSTSMLAFGTTSDLEARYANYEVHFSARTHEDSLRAREVMARVPGAQAVDDVATRFEVSIQNETSRSGISLASLFAILAEQDLEFSVERPMLESVFLKVIRAHNVEEEERTGSSAWTKMKRMV